MIVILKKEKKITFFIALAKIIKVLPIGKSRGRFLRIFIMDLRIKNIF